MNTAVIPGGKLQGKKQVHGLEIVLDSCWLVEPDVRETTAGPTEPRYDPGLYYGVALTTEGRIIVHVSHIADAELAALYDFDDIDDVPPSVLPDRVRLLALSEAAMRRNDDTRSL